MDHLAAPIPGQPYSLPLPQPDATSKPAPARDVTPAQRQQVQQLIDHFNESGFTLPTNLSALKQQWKKRDAAAGRGSWFSSFGAGGGGSGSSTPSKSHDEQQRPLNDVEKCYCSEEHFHRVFRAVKWDHDAALKRAESIVVWRREAGVEEMTAEHVSPEGETGKEIVFGYDKQARPVLYMVSRRPCHLPTNLPMADLFAPTTAPVSSKHRDWTPSNRLCHLDTRGECGVGLVKPPSPQLISATLAPTAHHRPLPADSACH